MIVVGNFTTSPNFAGQWIEPLKQNKLFQVSNKQLIAISSRPVADKIRKVMNTQILDFAETIFCPANFPTALQKHSAWCRILIFHGFDPDPSLI